MRNPIRTSSRTTALNWGMLSILCSYSLACVLQIREYNIFEHISMKLLSVVEKQTTVSI